MSKINNKIVSPETQTLLDEAETRRGYISGDDYFNIADDLGDHHPDYAEVYARMAAKDAGDWKSLMASVAVQAERARLTYRAFDCLIQNVVGDLGPDEMSLLETMRAEAEAEHNRLK